MPGAHATDNAGHWNHIKLYVSFLYLLCKYRAYRMIGLSFCEVTVGLGVVAMNYYLLREEVMVRISQIRKKFTECRAKLKYSLKKTSEK